MIYVFGLREVFMRGFECFPRCLAWVVVHFVVVSDICIWPKRGFYERV